MKYWSTTNYSLGLPTSTEPKTRTKTQDTQLWRESCLTGKEGPERMQHRWCSCRRQKRCTHENTDEFRFVTVTTSMKCGPSGFAVMFFFADPTHLDTHTHTHTHINTDTHTYTHTCVCVCVCVRVCYVCVLCVCVCNNTPPHTHTHRCHCCTS